MEVKALGFSRVEEVLGARRSWALRLCRYSTSILGVTVHAWAEVGSQGGEQCTLANRHSGTSYCVASSGAWPSPALSLPSASSQQCDKGAVALPAHPERANTHKMSTATQNTTSGSNSSSSNVPVRQECNVPGRQWDSGQWDSP